MKILLAFLLFWIAPEVFAHEDENIPEEVRVLQTVDLKDSSKAYIVAREAGHILGQPFQVELRLNCKGEEKEVSLLPVHDSMSVCDIDPNSLKLNKNQTAIAMKTKMADMNRYYKDMEEDPTAKVHCAEATKVIKFSLEKLCQ